MVDRSIDVKAWTSPASREAGLGGMPLASVLSEQTESMEEIHLLRGGIAHVKSGTLTSIGFIPYRTVAWTDLSTSHSARRSSAIVRIVSSHAVEALPSLTFADVDDASAFYARLLSAMA